MNKANEHRDMSAKNGDWYGRFLAVPVPAFRGSRPRSSHNATRPRPRHSREGGNPFFLLASPYLCGKTLRPNPLPKWDRLPACLLLSFFLFLLAAFLSPPLRAAEEKRIGGDYFVIAQIHYHGGGDWYEDKTSMIRLQARVQKEFGVKASTERKIVLLTDDNIFSYPMLFMTGHGNVDLSPDEAARLREYLDRGGFLWACDDYGMDESFRREMKKVYPDHPLVELPFNHEIYRNYNNFPNGLPKVHEHAGGPPHGYGVTDGKRLTVFYDFNTDIGDGLEAPEIHKDPEIKREAAFRMALNIVMYAITH